MRADATNRMSSAAIRQRGEDDLLRLARSEAGSPFAREALAELFRRFEGRVYQWCFRYARDHDRAMDLSQEVFLAAFESLSSFDGRAGFSSWLFAIARNRCVSAIRKRSPLDGATDDAEMLMDMRSRPDRDIEDEQEREAMLALIRKILEPIEQEAVCLQIFERMPIDSITDALGIQGSTGARGVLQNARRKLRAALAEQVKLREDSNHA